MVVFEYTTRRPLPDPSGISSESPGAVGFVDGGGSVSVTCIAGSRAAGMEATSAWVMNPLGEVVLVVVAVVVVVSVGCDVAVVAVESGGSGTSSEPCASGAQSAPVNATATTDAHAVLDRPIRTRRSLLTAYRGWR